MMSKTCPSCGYREADMAAQYCNKCGYPFPQSQQRKPAAAPAPAAATRRQEAPAPRSPPRAPKRSSRGSGAFGSLITENHLKLIYLAGAALILLLALVGILGMFGSPAKGAANASVTNLTAIADHPAGSPVFWIVFLIAGSVLWRMFCEIFVLLSRSSIGSPIHTDDDDDGGSEEDDSTYSGGYGGEYGGVEEGTMIECPKCHRIVPTEDLRECEHCGIQGCSNCIRSMGFLKKTLTCRECYEGK